MILENNNYSREALLNKTVLITGGGGGIGFEATRAFSYMGAKVIVAEIDADKGMRAQRLINNAFCNDNVDFYQIDIADEKQIDELYGYISSKYTRLDVIIHNAALVPMGAIDAVPITDWDKSYAVNLRAPVLITQKFLPSMRNTGGIIVFNPSNPGAYMSAYEIFKTAQVELYTALAEEIAGAPIIAYGITPGFVKTDTCVKAVGIVASSMGITADEFGESLNDVAVDVEIAGTGYAVSVVNAKKYNGQMTSSYQALSDAGLVKAEKQAGSEAEPADYDKLSSSFLVIANVFYDQYEGWQNKNLFQKKFILSDFKKQMGVSADAFKQQLETLQSQIQNRQWNDFAENKATFVKLKHFYEHQRELLQGFEKNAEQLASDTALLNSWIETLQGIIELL